MAIKKPPQNGTGNGDARTRLIDRILSPDFSWKFGIAVCVALILTFILYPQILVSPLLNIKWEQLSQRIYRLTVVSL